MAAEFFRFICFLGVNAPFKKLSTHCRHSGSCIWGKIPAFFVLPSRFPNGRFAPRTKNSCTYSNGYCSGLSPDFLIPAPAKKACRHCTGTQCRLFDYLYIIAPNPPFFYRSNKTQQERTCPDFKKKKIRFPKKYFTERKRSLAGNGKAPFHCVETL